MKKILPLMFTPLLIIAGCSGGDDAATPAVPAVPANETGQKATAPKKMSEDNVFKGYGDSIDAAKAVGDAAQQSIDSSQQKLDDAQR